MTRNLLKRWGIGVTTLLLVLSNVILPVTPAFAAPTQQQVFCNIQGNSGSWKAQIGGQSTEHEYPLLINGNPVFVQSESQVDPSWNGICQQAYGTPTALTLAAGTCGFVVTITLTGSIGNYTLSSTNAAVNALVGAISPLTISSTSTITTTVDLSAVGPGAYSISVTDPKENLITKSITLNSCDTPVVVAIPEAPAINDPCGSGNASWLVPANTTSITWAVNTQGQLIASTTTGYIFSDQTTAHNYGAPVETNTTPCTVPTITPCEAISGPELITAKEQFADYAYQDSRADGHYELTDTGLHLWTTLGDSTSKIAWYKSVNYPLSDIGVPSMDYTATSGIAPGMQIIVDFDNNGTADGILVGESIYGNNWWLSNSAANFVKLGAPHNGGGNGSQWYGTLNEWLAAFPDARVTSVGFSLGSGVIADGTLTSLTFGCHQWTFGKAPVVMPEPAVPTFTDTTCLMMGKYVIPNSEEFLYKVTIDDQVEVPADPGTYYLSGAHTVVVRAYYPDYRNESVITDEAWQWSASYTVPDCTPGKGSVDPPAPTVLPARTNTMLPAELPHTGPQDTYGVQGLIIALIAALLTYGAVYFAQPKATYRS